MDRILPFFDPHPSRGWFLYPERGQKGTFFDLLPPHLDPVVIECPYCKTDHKTADAGAVPMTQTALSRSKHVWPLNRYRQRFFVLVGHETKHASKEISIFSLNNVTVRLTKIMKNLLKHHKIRTFKVIFLC